MIVPFAVCCARACSLAYTCARLGAAPSASTRSVAAWRGEGNRRSRPDRCSVMHVSAGGAQRLQRLGIANVEAHHMDLRRRSVKAGGAARDASRRLSYLEAMTRLIAGVCAALVALGCRESTG